MASVRFPTSTGHIEIGAGLPTHLIAEIGLNHNGSERLARDMIYSASLHGATFVKLQKRSPSDLASGDFLDSPFNKCPSLGCTQREVRERLELSLDSYVRLREYADELGLIFFASAFDLPSLEFLLKAGVKIIKIASHSLTNGPLLERVAQLKLPTVLSLGGSTQKEQDLAISLLRPCPLVLMHCVSNYPTPDGLAKIDTITYLVERYGLPVGYSSHEQGVDLSVAASTLGACLIERHFTLSRSMIGLDQSISLEPSEFSLLASSIKRIHAARGVSECIQDGESGAKNSYHVAVRASRDLMKGEVLARGMLVCKQPLLDAASYFTGLEVSDLIGLRLLCDIPSDMPIPRNMVEA
jgi:sialic acid synthase